MKLLFPLLIVSILLTFSGCKYKLPEKSEVKTWIKTKNIKELAALNQRYLKKRNDKSIDGLSVVKDYQPLMFFIVEEAIEQGDSNIYLRFNDFISIKQMSPTYIFGNGSKTCHKSKIDTTNLINNIKYLPDNWIKDMALNRDVPQNIYIMSLVEYMWRNHIICPSYSYFLNIILRSYRDLENKYLFMALQEMYEQYPVLFNVPQMNKIISMVNNLGPSPRDQYNTVYAEYSNSFNNYESAKDQLVIFVREHPYNSLTSSEEAEFNELERRIRNCSIDVDSYERRLKNITVELKLFENKEREIAFQIKSVLHECQ